jgi:hypothetical protein
MNRLPVGILGREESLRAAFRRRDANGYFNTLRARSMS